jgi:hypothetical protein
MGSTALPLAIGCHFHGLPSATWFAGGRKLLMVSDSRVIVLLTASRPYLSVDAAILSGILAGLFTMCHKMYLEAKCAQLGGDSSADF